MLPKFVIVDVMKSGTSTVQHYLRQHPEIYMPENELHFFHDRMNGRWNNGIDWYRAQFQDASPEQIVGEKTPAYSYLPNTAERIHNILPDVKLIWIFRNPVDRAYSNYWHWVVHGREPHSFEEAVRREKRNYHQSYSYKNYLRRSLYVEQLDRYLEYFDRDQMHFALFEQVVSNPKFVLGNVFSFLEVDSEYARNLDKRVKKNSTSIPRWRIFRYFTRSVVDEIPLVRSMASRLDRRFNRGREPGYPEMNEKLRKRLEDYFRPYNEQLEERAGLNLDIWR